HSTTHGTGGSASTATTMGNGAGGSGGGTAAGGGGSAPWNGTWDFNGGLCTKDQQWGWSHPPPQGNPLGSVWSVAANDVWLVGNNGTTIHGHDGAFTWVLSGTTAHLRGVWASSASDVWAVGDQVIIQWNGNSWVSHDGGNDKLLKS